MIAIEQIAKYTNLSAEIVRRILEQNEISK